MTTGLAQLDEELSVWSDEGAVARIWWRDDDTVSATALLEKLRQTFRAFEASAALAVIPGLADESVAAIARDRTFCIWQHGWTHTFHDDGEFGEGRPISDLEAEAAEGQRALDRICGPLGWQRVFVPPNHQLSRALKARIHRLGYRGLSTGGNVGPPVPGLVEHNADIDVMDWPRGRLRDAEDIRLELLGLLRQRRRIGVAPPEPIGILTHHRVFDEDAWRWLSEILEYLRDKSAVEMVPAGSLFPAGDAEAGTGVGDPSSPCIEVAAPAEITMVITSCGRQELLVKTIDSFLAHNDYPLREILVVEDGDRDRNRPLEERYEGKPFRWIATDRRVGQIDAIDFAYGHVQSEYIFHCEDDWEFSAPGFIAKSLHLLRGDARIVQVGIRALNDTNNLPVGQFLFAAAGVPFRLIRPGYESTEWGTWHGFSFNPGLRRRRDYELVGSFRSLDPTRRMQNWEIERAASEFYRRRGFFAAILADEDGRGYVRHTGWGLRVGDPESAGG